MDQRLSLITLGVRDVSQARAFYEAQHPAARRRLSGWPANRRKAIVTSRQS
jgi:hypothetical protein